MFKYKVLEYNRKFVKMCACIRARLYTIMKQNENPARKISFYRSHMNIKVCNNNMQLCIYVYVLEMT